MKILIVLLFAIAAAMPVNAQTEVKTFKTDLLNLLEAKHDYEKQMWMSKQRNKQDDLEQSKEAAVYSEKYMELYRHIRDMKDHYIAYIDQSIDSETPDLGARYTMYDYQIPISSRIRPGNFMTHLTYFKIVKYSLENDIDRLPTLSEIPFEIEPITSK